MLHGSRDYSSGGLSTARAHAWLSQPVASDQRHQFERSAIIGPVWGVGDGGVGRRGSLMGKARGGYDGAGPPFLQREGCVLLRGMCVLVERGVCALERGLLVCELTNGDSRQPSLVEGVVDGACRYDTGGGGGGPEARA